MTIGSNIRRLREKHDMTQEEFGKLAGVSSMAVSQWENDRSVPRMGAIELIANSLKVSKSEIIDDEIAKPDGAISPSMAKEAYLPLLGRVHAGDAQEPDVVDGRISLPYEVYERHRNGYFLKVEGQCMSKVYPEGCYILVDPTVAPSNGSIAVVSIDGADYVMRRLYRGANTMILSPDSWEDGFEDIIVSDSDGHTVEFHGSVVWFQASEEMN